MPFSSQPKNPPRVSLRGSESDDTLRELLLEQKITNLHLQRITDEVYTEEDTDDDT
jgi:hypothetical protein